MDKEAGDSDLLEGFVRLVEEANQIRQAAIMISLAPGFVEKLKMLDKLPKPLAKKALGVLLDIVNDYPLQTAEKALGELIELVADCSLDPPEPEEDVPGNRTKPAANEEDKP